MLELLVSIQRLEKCLVSKLREIILTDRRRTDGQTDITISQGYRSVEKLRKLHIALLDMQRSH